VSELERLLEAAAPYPFPETPRLVEAVAARLPQRRGPSSLRLAVVAVAVLAATIAGVLAFSSGARSAVLDWLDAIPGVRISRVSHLPESSLLPGVEFGRPVSLQTAQRLAGFPVRLPTGIGEPSGVYFDRDRGSTVVTLRYGERLVLSEFHTNKVLFFKLATGDTRVENTKVGESKAVWIGGGEHAVYYFGAGEEPYFRAGTLAGNVLLWQEGSLGFRLEADISKSRAVKIAESLEP
jgi:hypothetical protein